MISISLDPFARQGLSRQKLTSVLAEKGFGPETYEIRHGAILTESLPVAQLLNRIRAYTDQSESMPLFLIKVRFKSDGEAFYVTKDPQKIKHDLSWQKDQTVVADESVLTGAGTMRVMHVNKYADLSRVELQRKYFDRHGGLLVRKFPSLNSDPDFIYALLQKGFYVRYGDEAGYLYIE